MKLRSKAGLILLAPLIIALATHFSGVMDDSGWVFQVAILSAGLGLVFLRCQHCCYHYIKNSQGIWGPHFPDKCASCGAEV